MHLEQTPKPKVNSTPQSILQGDRWSISLTAQAKTSFNSPRSSNSTKLQSEVSASSETNQTEHQRSRITNMHKLEITKQCLKDLTS